MRKLAIAALTLGALLAMAGLRGADLIGSRTERLEAAEARAANLAVIVAAYLGEAFAAGDASLRQLALHGQRVGGPAAPSQSWLPILASARAGLASIGAISVLDRNGIIRHSTRPEIIGQSRREQPAFRDAMNATSDDLVIGTPFLSIETPPRPLIPIVRRLTRDGQIEGVVAASFLPVLPQRFLRSVDVGQRGSLSVFHPHGVVLFHEPSSRNRIGDRVTGNPIFEEASRRGGSGTLRGAVSAAGPVLLTGYHTVGTPPIVVAVSLEQAEVLADWTKEARAAAALFGVAAITLAATLMFLFRQMDAKARAERALARAEQLEAERLRDANDRLELALQREQHARRDAEAASALKDEFLMTVSHELRTPLTAIYGWTHMLVAGAVPDERRDHTLRTIERNARAQLRLIDDLLDVSASAAGKLRLDVRGVDIAKVIEGAITTVTAAAAAKEITIVATVGSDVGRVPGDSDRLQQIVWNLLSNAVKFTPSGGRVDVTAARVDDEIEIAVADSGVGISPEFIPHVFERFRQEDAGTKRRYGGLGLGLAIVRRLVELHGGSVTAHSEGVNRGARFVVRLPAAPVPLPSGSAAEAPQSAV